MPRAMNTIQLSPTVLDWAASRAGESLYEFAKRISKRSAEEIANGVLTYAQAIKFAKTSGVSLGDLFLQSPPADRQLPVADFRTPQFSVPLKSDFFYTFDDIEFKQAWYREFLIAQERDPLDFVGKFKNKSPTAPELAKEIRSALDFADADLTGLKDPDELFALLAQKCEAIGILVFKNGVVGNNTHRSLSVDEFRGFALADALAPVIFINGADAPAAWVFTLAHELAHIWLGASGVSAADPSAENKIERFCNSVAAEILVPAKSFIALWQSDAKSSASEKLERARRAFKVSGLVIARRALDLGFIDRANYKNIYDEARLRQKRKSSEASGGDFYRTLAVRNSKRFSKEVAALAISGHITLGQAGKLLNTNPNKVVTFYAKQNPLSV
ncbi:ImmA/IrrE family metallo-endopeptidase [Propionivibrio soli]|uniref:ImmA/IrrE family metallo-endopeptidase n=1 Tax=Propionivibrio soli TaxID=2976531 RepID=UPI0021E8ED04|nr:ImmA/IrrE family metallo-endopeptidase [Propionivibrio soli]